MAGKSKLKNIAARIAILRSRQFRREFRRLSHFKLRFEQLEQRLPLTLGYSTYLGGSGNEQATDIAADSEGNSYVIGTTRSAELGGIDSPDTGTNRAFLTKFKSDGQIEYTTLLGPTPKFDASGFAESIGWQVVVGTDDLPLVSFETFETSTLELQAGGLIPLPGPPHLLHVEKLDADGEPMWSAIASVLDIPGHFDPFVFFGVHMTSDDENDVYLAYTAVRPTPGGGVANDTFLTKLSSSGEQGNTDNLDSPVSAIAVDGLHNVYVALNFADVNQTTDVYIDQYDPFFNLLQTASLGGERDDFVADIAVDPNQPGRVYLVGHTESHDFPLMHAFQTLPDEPSDGSFDDNAFITLLDLNEEVDEQLVASTYFGGSGSDELTAIALDLAGNVYVAGSTTSPNLPTAHALQGLTEATFATQFGGVRFAQDLVVAKFDSSLTKPEYSTYFGGKGHDSYATLAVDHSGTIHVAATSVGRNRNSEDGAFEPTADFPIKNAAQPEFGGSDEGFAPSTDAVVFAIAQRGAIVGRGAHATTGREFTHAVAEFTSQRRASFSDFTVAINWGDGVSTSGFVTQPNSDSSQYFVHGTHQYDQPGAYPVTVTVTDSVTNRLSPIRTVNVSQSAKSQIGGAITVDPTDPTRLFAAMTDYQVDAGIRVATSDDSGATWSPRLVGTADDTVLPPARGNPDVLFDDFGNLFLAYSGTEDNIVVAWSTDGGRTFKVENRVQFIFFGAEGSSPGSPRLAFSETRNEVWVTYETSSVRVAGASASGLGVVGGFTELTVTGSAGGKHSDIAVGPDGAVAVVWQTISTSGGVAQLLSSADADGLGAGIFAPPITVGTTTTDGILHTAAQEAAIPLGARLAWDTSPGPNSGRLYAAYVDLVEGLPNPPGTPELTLLVTFSDDMGVSWSVPQRVTFGPNFQSMFQPSIALDPMTGVLAVGWYGTTNSDPTELSTFTGFFVATSGDGITFSNAQRVNIEPSNVIAPELSELDATSYGAAPRMAFYNGRLYPIWSDNTNLDGGNYSAPQFETATRIVGVIDVKAAPPAIRPIAIDVIQGQSFTKPVATFTLGDPSATAADFTARISWGDQSSDSISDGVISQPGGPGTPFTITATHTYTETGAYPIAVSVRDVKTGVATKSVSNVSAQQGSQGQPTIAVDPSNPNRLFAAWSDRAGLQKGIPVATSDDGGVTWHKRTIANGSDGLFLPAQAGEAVFDQFGNLFLTYVTQSPIFHTVVLSSKDGGKVFTLLRRFDDPLAVEPSIAVGPGEGDQGGSVWVTWSHGAPDNLTVVVAGAHVDGLDRFQSFNEQVVAPVTPDGLFRIYGDIAVGPQGQVMVTYSKGVAGGLPEGPAEIVVQLDPDGLGSQPFGLPVLVTDTNVGPHTSIPPQAISAIDAQGSLAWDRSDGEHQGRAYLIYTDSASIGDPDTEILLRYSDDNGANWSAPTSIDNTTKTSFLPSVAVDQTTGNLAMAWYDSEGDAGEGSTTASFVATLSDDGGQSHRVRYVIGLGPSDATSSSVTDGGGQFQYGRFSGLAFTDGIFQPIWADNSVELSSVPDPRNFDIASARIAVAQVSNAPIVVQMIEVNDLEGTPFTRQIAKFTDPSGGGSVGDYKAEIDWGDGTPRSDGEILEEIDGGFSVLGTHEYEKFGQFQISVTIKGNHAKGAGTITAVIENAPVFLYFGDVFQGLEEVRVVRETEFTKVVATFIDQNPGSKISDFDSTIDWGDGSFSDGTLAFYYDGGPGEANYFTVSGTHKYLAENVFTAIVSVVEKSSGIRTDQSGSAISGDPPLEVKAGDYLDIEALEGINTGDLLLARFTVPDDIEVQLQSSLGEYIATISWGDGEVDTNIIPFVTSEDVTVVGRHTYATVGEFYPSITLVDDSGGSFYFPLVAIVEPDVTAQTSAPLPGLTYNPISDRFVGELVITNTSSTDISGPLFVVIHDLPDGVSLESFTAVDGEGHPLYKVNQSKLPAGASLPPITLEFSNPSRVHINYSVQVFDGLRPDPLGGSGVVFEPNRGQANAAADFIARGQGYSIGLSAGQVSLVLSGNATQAGAAALVELVGANTSPVGVAMNPQPGVSNYFVGQTAISGVPHFGRVRYSQVYAGIDIEYYGRDGLLEYDWIVRPQANPDAIAVRFGGVDSMVLDNAGNLRLQVDGGELVQRAPVAYQTIGGVRVDVIAEYDLRADGTVGIILGVYDHSIALVIDPVLVYSTYLGGSGGEVANTVAVDEAGNTYVSGITGSSDFFTVNPFDPELNQPDTPPFALSFDAFVTKFDDNGVLVYSTYLGGGSSGFDPVIRETIARSIAVDYAGHVWVAGYTGSLLFPKTTTAPSGYEANPSTGGSFLTELSADGSSILYSSVMSLSLLDIAVDDAGEVYASAIGGALKLNPATNTFRYIVNLGGGIASGIAVDSLGQAYVTGFTNSPSFPVKNALFPVLGTPETFFASDRESTGFVVKLSTDGTTLFSTYLGSTFEVGPTDIAVDDFGSIYVVGSTQANDLPVPGGLDTTYGGNNDGFLIKLAGDGQALVYGTYVGGSGDDRVTGIAVDSQGRTYLSGTTSSTDLPTVRAHQPTSGGSLFLNVFPTDGFAASIAADGGSYEYLTYWGGHENDSLRGVAIDSKGNASFAGNTSSPDLLTSNAAQQHLVGFPAFVVRLLAGDAGALSLHNAPFTAVEGTMYNGLVAFFSSNGTETADQFSASIDWGDGVSTTGTIAGNFREGFQILGNHLYAEVGAHDVFVTLRDSLGRTVTSTSSGTVNAGAEGRVLYKVAIDTATLAGVQGLLSFQFNPAAILGSPEAEARITELRLFGGVAGASTIDGDVSQVSSSQFTLRPSDALNRLVKDVTLGARIEFDLELVGPGLSTPALNNLADMFAVQLLSASGIVPLLGADATASLLRVSLSPDGKTEAHSSGAAVTVAANGRAAVKNGPISLTLAPFTIQEGLEFNGPVATFTDGNPLEIAGEFTASIDWGDGSPMTNGVVTGSAGNFTVSGTHVYQTVGSYVLVVKVVEPDGLEVSRGTGRSILAADTIKNNWRPSTVAPVSGDFNGDGILDLAVGPYISIPEVTGEGVGIFLGRGDGTFAQSDLRATGTTIAQLVAADFNNDGRLDVAVAVVKFGETTVELLLGNGDGTLQASVPLTELKNPGSLLAADFNRDGKIDLIYTQSDTPSQNTRSSMLKVALGLGDGTFGTPQLTSIPLAIHRVVVADVNGDAAPDVVLASVDFAGATALRYYRGVGDGSFNVPTIITSGLAFTASLVISELDGDGHLDIAASVGPNLHIYSGNGDGTFSIALQIPAASGVVAAGDFNRDGRVDLAMTERGFEGNLGRITVFLNDAPGIYASGVSYEGVAQPSTLLAADFDRDGYLDLATSGFTSVFSVLPGIGDGTFASARRYGTGLVRVDTGAFREAPQGVVVTDLNGDSHSDAVLLFGDGPIVTQLGNSDGTFQSVVSSGPFSAINTGNVGLGFGSFRNPELADFNNDGRLDLVGTSQGTGIGIVFGQGDGAFPTSYTEARGGFAVVLGDFNQDGRLDTAAMSGSFGAGISLAKADGTFQNAVFYPGVGNTIASGDFNGDSRIDLVVQSSIPSSEGSLIVLSVLLGNADGTFAAGLNTAAIGNATTRTGILPQAFKEGDFNSDGRLDLVVLGSSGTGLVLPGNADGTFGTALTFTTLGGPDSGLTSGRNVAVGDFNADGKLDIVTASIGHANFFIPGGGLSVLLGNGDFTFQAAVTYADQSNPTAITVGDFNQDGRLDIAMANINNGRASSGLVSILLGNPNGSFQNPVNYSTVGANPRSIAAGDLNADGIADLAVYNNSGDTAILIGTGTGTFRPSVNYFTRSDGLLSGPIGIAIGDLNNDGHADLIASSTLLYGRGDGTFPNRQLFTYLPPAINIDIGGTSAPSEVAAGDLNADGNVDLVVAMAGTTVVLLGNGNGSFMAPVRLTPPTATGLGAGSNRVSLADMDGDGDLDLVTLHPVVGQTGGGVAVWRNDGQGRFSVPIVRSVPFPAYQGADLELGDLDGDGFFDVVVTDGGLQGTDLNASGGVSVLLGIGNGTLALPVRYLMPPRQSAFGVKLGDLNHDGHPELVMLSSPIGSFGFAGAVAVFANRGDGSFGTARLLDFGGAAVFLATGDFNGDGSADIIIPISNANSFSIIFAGDGPVLVTDAPVTVTAANINPRVGSNFTTTVATFIDDNPFGIASDFTATIDWGDGQTSTGTIRDNPLGGFQVTGTHTYASIGVFTTTVSVREIGEGTHRASATARVSTTDQALTATGLTFNAIEDLPFTGIVATFTDANPNGSASDFSALVNWGDGSNSTGAIAAKAGGGFNVFGTHTYANPGTFAVIVTVNDIGGSSAIANSTVQVALHVNQPPVANNDSYSTEEDSTLNVTASRGLLANDTDLDGDALNTVIVAPATHGILTLTGNGSFLYVPNPNFFGTDSFTYRANDGTAVGNLATVTITVNPVNDAPLAVSETATTDEDTAVVVNILANDSDVDGTIDPATVAIVAQPLYGSLQVNPVTGAVTYTPSPNAFGFDSFRYRVKDLGGLESNIATVSIFVKPINDIPVANNDTYLVNEDITRNVIVSKGLLANDTDIDGNTLAVTLVAAPTHGMLTLHPNGSFTYLPESNYFGSDSFLYRTSDGFASSPPALVSLTILSVNDAPVVASLGNVAFPEGAALTRASSFSDIDSGDSWTATVDYGDGTGVQTLALTGSTFTLNHAFADSGIYLTTVKIVDQDGGSGSATFEVRVQNLAAAVNAGSDQLVLEGTLVNVAATFLDLGTVDTHTALIDWGDGTENTSVSVTEATGAGMLSTSHVYADNGTYIVTLTVTDDEGAVGTDQLTITVGNLPPVTTASPDRTVNEGQLFSLVANFSDPGSADTHTATINWGDGTPVETAQVTNASSGRSASASHRYADNGIYAVTVTVRDDDGAAAVDTLILTVSNVSPLVDSGPDRIVNSVDVVVLPVADIFDLVDEDFGNEDFGTDRLLRQAGSFVDPGALDTHTATIDWGDGTTQSISVTERSFGPGGAPTGVSGVVQAQHRYASRGTYTATLRLTDKDGGIGVDSFVVTVLNSGNNPPVADDDEATTDEDTPLSIEVLTNDSFAPDLNETLNVTSITQPAHGTAAINLNGTVTYTPNLNYFGADQFSYTLSDGRGGTATATVRLMVNSVNDVATIDGTSTGAVTEDAIVNQVSGALTVRDADPGQSVFQTPENLQGTYGTFTFVPSTGVWTYTLDNSRSATNALTAGQVVSDAILVRSLDGTATRSIVIAITGQSPIDVTSLVTFRYYGAQYNARTKTYAFYGTITNKSNQAIQGPIELGWSKLLPTTARAKGNTGIWTDGSPFFDFSSFVGSDGILQPGETSQPRTFAVTVAAPGAYSFGTRVTGIVSSIAGSGSNGENSAKSNMGISQLNVIDRTASENHITTNVDKNATNETLVEAGKTFDLTDAKVTLRNVEGIDIRGTGNNKLFISIDNVKAASTTTDTLEVVANAGDIVSFGVGWKAETPKFINGVFTHIISESASGGTARVEIRNERLLTNPLTPFDADRNGTIQALDALRIINELSRRGSGAFTLPTKDSEISKLYFDVNADNRLTALDALRIINAIARINRGGKAEGEAVATPEMTTTAPVDLSLFSRQQAVLREVPEVVINAVASPKLSRPLDNLDMIKTSVAAIDDFMTSLDSNDQSNVIDDLNENTLERRFGR